MSIKYFVPTTSLDIHINSCAGVFSSHKVTLGQTVVADLGVMVSDDAIVWPRHAVVLHVDDLGGFGLQGVEQIKA